MIIQNIITDRLILIPVTLQIATLLLSNDPTEIENIGFHGKPDENGEVEVGWS